jgi:ankyrin repeat protein
MNQNPTELIAALRGKVELGQQLITRADTGGYHGVYDLLTRGAAVDACDESGWTPLLAASRHGHFKVIDILVSSRAKIQTFDNKLITPLSIAAQNGNKRLF